LQRIARIRELIPECGISTDTISGFCTETEEEHQETLSLIEAAQFDFAYMFKYSERPGTLAAKKLEDDIAEDVKGRRLQEIIDLQMRQSEESNRRDIGKTFEVLVEGPSKKSPDFLQGRNTQNKVIVFPRENFEKGQYVNVLVQDCTSATLKGVAVL
jgi:tRNA-2-methylthio-N6-dimethylallyladenosine synthase